MITPYAGLCKCFLGETALLKGHVLCLGWACNEAEQLRVCGVTGQDRTGTEGAGTTSEEVCWGDGIWAKPEGCGKVKVLVLQSRPTLCDSMDCSTPGSSVHGYSPGKNTGMGCHFLFQGTFPTQGSNPGPPHCRQTLYHLSHQDLREELKPGEKAGWGGGNDGAFGEQSWALRQLFWHFWAVWIWARPSKSKGRVKESESQVSRVNLGSGVW